MRTNPIDPGVTTGPSAGEQVSPAQNESAAPSVDPGGDSFDSASEEVDLGGPTQQTPTLRSPGDAFVRPKVGGKMSRWGVGKFAEAPRVQPDTDIGSGDEADREIMVERPGLSESTDLDPPVENDEGSGEQESDGDESEGESSGHEGKGHEGHEGREGHEGGQEVEEPDPGLDA